MVQPDEIFWERAIFPSRFRFIDRLESLYWSKQVRWKQHTLSALGQFTLYHMCRFYNLQETACDCFLVRIAPNFAHVEVCHCFRFQQEPIFSHKLGVLIADGDMGLWVVAYTERVVHACVG